MFPACSSLLLDVQKHAGLKHFHIFESYPSFYMQSMTDWVFILPWSISLLLSVYFPTILPNRGNEYVWHSGKLVQSYMKTCVPIY